MRYSHWNRRTKLGFIALLFTAACRVLAGPPFLTDDPEPTDYLHWETYLFASGDYEDGGYTINGPALELNYGAFPDTQLSLTIPMTWVGGNVPSAAGLGDLLVGAKYRFLDETNWWPQIAVFPAITIPTGNAERGLGFGRVTYDLPVWLQKSWGPWTSYGGGGAIWNFAPGFDNYGFAGWLLERHFGDHLLLGGEAFGQTQSADNDGAFVALNFGGQYQFNDHFSLLASAGHSVAGQGELLWYVALNLNW